MSLSGSLNDSSVLETLQLIGIQQKTGTLEIRAGKNRCDLQFHEGHLVGCRPSSPEQPHPFFVTLSAIGCCSQDEARRLIASWGSEEARKAVPAVTGLAPALLDSLRHRVIQAVLDRALLWNRGEFRFTPGAVEQEIHEVWNVEQALLETMRRLDEVADMKSSGLRPESVPRRTDQGPPSTPVPSDPRVRPRENDDAVAESSDPLIRQALLNRSDGKRSLRELIEFFALSEWDVFTAAMGLQQEGSILLEGTKRVDERPETLPETTARTRTAVTLAFLILMTAVFAFIGVFAHFTTRSATWPHGATAWEERRSHEADRALRYAAELARIRTGHEPASVEELVQLDLWPKDRAVSAPLSELIQGR